MYVHHMCTGSREGQKIASDPLELKSQAAVSLMMSVLGTEPSKCSLPLSHLSPVLT